MSFTSDQTREFQVSFGLNERTSNPYCDRFRYSPVVLCRINGITPPKPQALARRDIPALAL